MKNHFRAALSVVLLSILFVMLPSTAFSTGDVYHFSSIAQKTRFEKLTSELRCLVCQNETVAESGATLASDLRDEIHTKMLAGATDQEIVRWLVSRYGNFILYRPPLNTSTLLLWFGPLLFLIAGLIFLINTLRRAGVDTSP